MVGLSVGASFVITLNPVSFYTLRHFLPPIGIPNQHPKPHTDKVAVAIPLFFSKNERNSIGKTPGKSKGAWLHC